ncbi:hypothetical protein ACOME3_001783 [Neoechinorhynchus agilis]
MVLTVNAQQPEKPRLIHKYVYGLFRSPSGRQIAMLCEEQNELQLPNLTYIRILDGNTYKIVNERHSEWSSVDAIYCIAFSDDDSRIAICHQPVDSPTTTESLYRHSGSKVNIVEVSIFHLKTKEKRTKRFECDFNRAMTFSNEFENLKPSILKNNTARKLRVPYIMFCPGRPSILSVASNGSNIQLFCIHDVDNDLRSPMTIYDSKTRPILDVASGGERAMQILGAALGFGSTIRNSLSEFISAQDVEYLSQYGINTGELSQRFSSRTIGPYLTDCAWIRTEYGSALLLAFVNGTLRILSENQFSPSTHVR